MAERARGSRVRVRGVTLEGAASIGERGRMGVASAMPGSAAAWRTSARMRQASAQRAQVEPWSARARTRSKGSSPAAAAQ